MATTRVTDAGLPYDTEMVAGILERWRDTPGSLLPILQEVQLACGCIPPESVPQIARALNRSRAEIHGVVSFYDDFRTTPASRHVVRVCQAESCQAMGSRELTHSLETEFRCSLGQTTPDGELTLEPVYCLGLCACSPAVTIDDEPLGRATVGAVTARLRIQTEVEQ